MLSKLQLQCGKPYMYEEKINRISTHLKLEMTSTCVADQE